MKTSSKILMGLAAAAVAMCVVNVFVTAAQFKKYDAEAQRLVARLDETPIKMLDISLSPGYDPGKLYDLFSKEFYVRGNDKQELMISASKLGNVRIDGETLCIENFDADVFVWKLFHSPSLETVVIHRPGEPDAVLDLTVVPKGEMPAEPETHQTNEPM